MPFPEVVVAELARARAKHSPMHSAHEGFAVLYEEVDELWDEVRSRDVNHAAMLKELIQVAAMAQRMAEDVVLPKIEANKG